MQGMKVIKKIDFDPDFEPVLFSPVIQHDVLSGLEKASEIISRAKKEGVRLRKRSKDVLAQAVVEKEEERKRGFEEGYQEGLAQLTEKILQAEGAREKILKESEPQIIQMVMEIAEKVIAREVARGAVVDVVKSAVQQCVGERIVVKIHPSDFETLRSKEAEFSAVLRPSLKSLSWKEDEAVSPGGCVVESEAGTVDARLETQLKAIRKALGL